MQSHAASAQLPPHGVMLLADDIGVNRQLFEMNVRKFFGRGWSVVSVATAEAAVAEASARDFDVILMD